uniref:Ig-like domain-containing protein n=1 Tax=Anabas testudineus TaxID=64144 RepID=A0A3Q1KA69_ANATE
MFLVCKSNTCLPSVGAQPFCPIELNPSIVVVKYGDPVSINCSTSNSLVETMGWEAPQGGTGMKPTKHLTWTLERLTEWTIEPSCFINLLPGATTLQVELPLQILYYLAPVQNLTVRWYKGDTLIYTDTFKDPNMKPVNQSSFLNFTMTRRDNGVTLRCEAHMDLEPEGPQLLVSSQEYDITVQCKYFICRLISNVLVLEGETLESKCPVEGNPTPFVTWRKDGKSTNLSIPLSRKDAGEYSVEAEGFSSIHEKVQVLVLCDLVMEDQLFQLRCDITNVAPARSLAVWCGCLPEKNTNCISMIQSPVNVSSTINITLNRSYTNVQFRCEAELNLGLGGPQPPPIMISSPLNITVHSKPVINSSKIPKTMPVFRGYPEELVCEADGHPHPEIKWVYSSDKVARVSDNMLTVSEAGLYNCTATNPVGSDHYVVEVILKEDYLPLIAGFVAVTVVAISVIFLFIYSIYYKNTKMRRYSLKNPRFSNHTGNVAHNGWDTQFPMTKLS